MKKSTINSLYEWMLLEETKIKTLITYRIHDSKQLINLSKSAKRSLMNTSNVFLANGSGFSGGCDSE